jgi:hypothetical protein
MAHLQSRMCNCWQPLVCNAEPCLSISGGCAVSLCSLQHLLDARCLLHF